jgi:uncharacterized protein involved in type VI secretion and phage assembly
MSRDWPNPLAGALTGGRAVFDPHRGALVLGRVASVADPEGLSRVEVAWPLHADDDTMQATAWAPVATAFAGTDHGAFLLPGVGDVVVLGFLSSDPRSPVVLGSVWHGGTTPAESLPGDAVDRWVLTGRNGTRVAIVEGDGSPVISLTTPGGVSLTVSDEGGGTIEASTNGSTLTMTPSEVSIKSGTIKLDAGDITLSAGSVTVNAATATFSSVVTTQVMQATTVIATTYTPGAGNIL